jgi:riboflavin biosynthesis pyrimidine reductase
MVASVDGATVVDGRSGGLSSPADQAVLAALRQAADVVLVGAGTVRAEGYGAPRKSGLRIGVVTASGDVDPQSALFRSGTGFLVTTLDAPDHGLPAVRAGHGRVDLAAAVSQLDGDVVHAEGGPTLNAALLAADLVDEVNLTLSPTLVGGDGPRLVNGTHAHPPRPLHLAHVCEVEGFLFLRYVRA